MNKLLYKIFFVLIGLVLVDFSVRLVCDKMLDALDSENKCRTGSVAIENYSLNAATCDLLIVGSSPANCGFNSNLIRDSLYQYSSNDWKVVNASRSQSGIPWKYAVIMSAIDRKPPKAIILDLNSHYSLSQNNSAGIVSVMKPYYYRNKYVKEVLDVYDNANDKLVYKICSLYRFRTMVFTLPIQFFKPFGGDGYMPYSATIDSSETKSLRRIDSTIVDEQSLSYLNKIISTCKNNDVKLIVTFTPKLIQTDSNSDSYKQITSICKYNNVPLIDMENDSLFSDYHLHYDKSHLNVKGAKLYSSIISKKLKDILFESAK